MDQSNRPEPKRLQHRQVRHRGALAHKFDELSSIRLIPMMRIPYFGRQITIIGTPAIGHGRQGAIRIGDPRYRTY